MTLTVSVLYIALVLSVDGDQISCAHSPIREFAHRSSHISVIDLSAPGNAEYCTEFDMCVPSGRLSDAIVQAVAENLFVAGRLNLNVAPGELVYMTDVPDRAACAYLFDGRQNLVFWDDDEVLLAIPVSESINGDR